MGFLWFTPRKSNVCTRIALHNLLDEVAQISKWKRATVSSWHPARYAIQA